MARLRFLPPAAVFAAGLAGLLAPGNLAASTVRHLPLEAMAREAHSVFAGEVVGVRSQLDARRNRIHTFVTVRVSRYWKGGRGGEFVTLRVLGGEAEGYRLLVSGTPSFRLDEEVLVFSEGGAGRVPTVLGMAAGKFTVETDPETGERMLHRSLGGLTFHDDAGRPLTEASLSRPRERLPLDELRRTVERALSES